MDNTNYTTPIEDNLMGISDKQMLNFWESKGVVQAEYFLYQQEINTEISISLLLEIHKIAFSFLYEWAGKWRNVNVQVGNLIPPPPKDIPMLMYQFIDEVKYRNLNIQSKEDLADMLAYAHHRFVEIHPFNNGNGRTARLFTNFLLLTNSYMPIEIYHREGDKRETYIQALRNADKGEYNDLKSLIFDLMTPF